MKWQGRYIKVVDFKPGSKPRQLAEAMAEDMASGELSEGDYLPSQQVLAELNGISVATVGVAFALLRKHNLIGRDISRRYRVMNVSRVNLFLNAG